ncbi:MAG: hypothetical protein U0694_07390 [Anaerolineae bacterium]
MIVFESGEGADHSLRLWVDGYGILSDALDEGIAGQCTNPIIDGDGETFYFLCNGAIYRNSLYDAQERFVQVTAAGPIVSLAPGLGVQSFAYSDSTTLYDYSYALDNEGNFLTMRLGALVNSGTYQVFDLFWLATP